MMSGTEWVVVAAMGVSGVWRLVVTVMVVVKGREWKRARGQRQNKQWIRAKSRPRQYALTPPPSTLHPHPPISVTHLPSMTPRPHGR